MSESAIAIEPIDDEPTIDSMRAMSNKTEQWSFHGQSTYIAQQRNSFNSPYIGQNSLLNRSESPELSHTLTMSAFLGARLWRGAEIYYNGEMFQGGPFSGELVGLGGIQSGELQKGFYSSPVFFTTRAFLRQTIGLGGGKEHVESEVNQLSGNIDKNRLVFSYGKFSALDFFDDNTYSHDPRTQFMNFSIFSMGAYGYAADTIGSTYGLVLEWYQSDWIVKAARFAMPSIPNTSQLDYSLSKNYGNQLEVTRQHQLYGQPGAIRALLYQQRADMGNYQNAINLGQATDTTPNVMRVRQPGTNTWGYGLNVEQAFSKDIGIFARWSSNPGTTETQTLDISQSLSGGISIKGSSWTRPHDTLGIGFAINEISSSQINYLKKGGMTAFIGDGNLSYKPEKILEIYYSMLLHKNFSLSLDYQRIANPAYNAARGPVNIFGFRAHIEL